MMLPLRRYAPSPSLAVREGDDTFGAGRRGRLRPFLGVHRFGSRLLQMQRPTSSPSFIESLFWSISCPATTTSSTANGRPPPPTAPTPTPATCPM
ncbi:hypothetical protein FSY59_10895 [Comamonas sp. Z3]|nr:hypothetical protein FSY59_10895 [Comamonas sp. Z3]